MSESNIETVDQDSFEEPICKKDSNDSECIERKSGVSFSDEEEVFQSFSQEEIKQQLLKQPAKGILKNRNGLSDSVSLGDLSINKSSASIDSSTSLQKSVLLLSGDKTETETYVPLIPDQSDLVEEDEEDEPWATSKWETSEDKLNKLDGLARKRKSADSEDEGDVPLSMEQWLQAHLPEDYSVRYETAPGKKRVRWADIEERREQERVRKFGFVVGSMGTNWNRLSDPTFGNAALVKTKYI